MCFCAFLHAKVVKLHKIEKYIVSGSFVCLLLSSLVSALFLFFVFCFFVVYLSSLVSGFLIYFLFVCLFVYSLPMSSLLHFLFVCLFVACVFPGFWFVCLFVCGLPVSSLVSLSFFSSFIVRCVSLVFPQVHYCSVFCQKLHWSTHKKHCQRLAKEYE